MRAKVLIEKKDDLYLIHVCKGEECNTIETYDLYFGEGMTEPRDGDIVYVALVNHDRGGMKYTVEVCGGNKRVIYKVDDVLISRNKKSGYISYEDLF